MTHDVGRWLLPHPGTIILQPTSLCPLACTYCYLPERELRQEMAPETAQAVLDGFGEEWGSGRPVELVWHGGEPLAIGHDKLLGLIRIFEPLRSAGRIQHMIQTGATLLTHQWCDLFELFDVKVGISIDGPGSVNGRRVDRSGRSTFDRAIEGIGLLRERGIPFTALSVVGRGSIGDAKSTLDFLADLGCSWVGLNIEAREAANATADVPNSDEARHFWRQVLEWVTRQPSPAIRDVEWLLGFLAADPSTRSADARHDLIPTIDWKGDVVLLSPELLGVRDEAYDDFIVGNVTARRLIEPFPVVGLGGSGDDTPRAWR